MSIRFEGLKRLQGVWLELRSTDAKGTVFVSRAAFGADEDGVLDLARARPLAGSAYSGGPWQMGLVTSMEAPNALAHTDYAWGSTPRRFVLTAISASQPIASTSFVRRWRQGLYTTVRATIAHAGFVGTFYAPAGARDQEAVLAIGGEEGGVGSPWLGERLAAHGIPTLVVGYFHAPGSARPVAGHPTRVLPHRARLARPTAGGRCAAGLAARRLVRQRGGALARLSLSESRPRRRSARSELGGHVRNDRCRPRRLSLARVSRFAVDVRRQTAPLRGRSEQAATGRRPERAYSGRADPSLRCSSRAAAAIRSGTPAARRARSSPAATRTVAR